MTKVICWQSFKHAHTLPFLIVWGGEGGGVKMCFLKKISLISIYYNPHPTNEEIALKCLPPLTIETLPTIPNVVGPIGFNCSPIIFCLFRVNFCFFFRYSILSIYF